MSVDRKISLLRVQTSFTTTHRNGIGQPDYTTEYAKRVGRIILFVSECHGQMHKTSLTYISITSRYEPNDVNWVRCVMTNNLFRYYIKHLNREHWDVLNHPCVNWIPILKAIIWHPGFEYYTSSKQRDLASMETIEQIIGNNNQVHCEKDKSSLISRNSLWNAKKHIFSSTWTT